MFYQQKIALKLFRWAILGRWGVILYTWCNFCKSWKFGKDFILVLKILVRPATHFSIRKCSTDNLVGFKGKKMQNDIYLSAASTNIHLSCFSRIQVTSLQTQMHGRRLQGEEQLLCLDHVLRICNTGRRNNLTQSPYTEQSPKVLQTGFSDQQLQYWKIKHFAQKEHTGFRYILY